MPINPNDPIQGFEGLIIEDSPVIKPKYPIGLEGFVLVENSPIKSAPVGFEGVLFAYSSLDRFLKITDFRGNPLKGVIATAENVGGSVSAVSDSDGLVALRIDISGTTTIRLTKEKTFKALSYTYASEPALKEIVLQPPLL